MTSLQNGTTDESAVRPTVAAGIMYPGSREELESLLDRLLGDAETGAGAQAGETAAEPFGAVVPHAAYEFAGASIAAALRPLRERISGEGKVAVGEMRPRRIVLIAPVHREHFTGCALPAYERLSTPLGDITVDREAAELLLSGTKHLRRDNLPFLEEHAVELPLPFLQHIAPQLPVLPLLSGDNSAATMRSLLQAVELFGSESLLVISSNLTGYVDPLRGEEHRDRFLELLEGNRPGEIIEAWRGKRISACAAAACAAVLRAMDGAAAYRCGDPFLQQPESGGRVVHYGSFTLHRSIRKRQGQTVTG